MLIRNKYLQSIHSSLRQFPIVALLGPRQCGKTTLAREVANTQTAARLSRLNYFDLEDSEDLARLEDPKLALSSLSGLVVIDEIQRMPGLFKTLRFLADRQDSTTKFLILGSASRDLIQQSSESLAGRVCYVEITPFQMAELPSSDNSCLWLRGGFPKSFYASSEQESWIWRNEYIRTYLEQDLPNLGVRIPPMHIRRFWMMLSHFHGQIFNASQLASSLDISDHTVKRYLDILTGTFMVRQLQPWFENTKKRQIKSPKIYFRDSGIFHFLQGIQNHESLLTNPKLGASWEGFALEQVIYKLRATPEEAYFWGVHGAGELDLLIVKGGKRIGFEIKHTSSPTLTHSIKLAIDELKLDQFFVIFNGSKKFQMADKVVACPLPEFILDEFEQDF